MDNIELKVLIIDDEEDNIRAFRAKARAKKISLTHFKNFKDGIAELEKNFHNYNGVILDAKCFATKDDEINKLLTDDEIDAACHKVKNLTEENGYIPHCVNTGYSAQFKRRLENQGFKVFAKPQQNDDVLEYIRDQNRAENKNYFEHKEIMNLFKGNLLNTKYLKPLSETLDDLKNKEYRSVKSTAGLTRDILEEFLGLMVRLSIIPLDIRSTSVNNVAIYIVGKKKDVNGRSIDKKFLAPDYISRSISLIHDLTSHYLHSNNSTDSKYAQSVMIYSLFEVLDWFNKRVLPQCV